MKSYEKPTIGFNRHHWKTQIRNFAEKYFDETFTMRDIRRTFKTLGGEIKISKNERDIVQYHVNSDISDKHYDKYDYFSERKSVTMRWEYYLNNNAQQIINTNDGQENFSKDIVC
jgi:hypothetical protein